MAHYAFLDENNLVTNVIKGIDETELIEGLSPEKWYEDFQGQRCVRTSINNNIRKNFAGVGMYYDEERDAFIPIKPFVSWLLDEETCQWYPPIPMPEIEEPYSGKSYVWNKKNKVWDEV